ncbi:MAG TPA: glycosyltransferase family 1 protein [Syntrophomonadaceae bacterium]|nr:glycosyltransferase family 1 protein [Syntrophomonadaceae bacterium]
MNTGGAETFLMKLYRAIDTNMYQLDFCVASDHEGYYEKEIIERGGKIFRRPVKSKNLLAAYKILIKIVRDNHYDYVMRVGEHSFAAFDLLAAKLGGAKHLIMRSSNAGSSGGKISNLLHKIFGFLPRIVPTVKIAPSRLAAEYTFGKLAVKNKNVFFLNNAIDVPQFIFNKKIREKYRSELDIEDKFVIGHVGRFSLQKNHKFLLEIFAEIKKIKPDSIFILIGNGELEPLIREKAECLGILDNLKMLGIRSEIPELMMAMDVFAFPSFYEGMPNTVIEAQATGLRCVIADTITPEANITGLVKYLPLNAGARYWANIICEYYQGYPRNDMTQAFYQVGYDIRSAAQFFTSIVFGL